MRKGLLVLGIVLVLSPLVEFLFFHFLPAVARIGIILSGVIVLLFSFGLSVFDVAKIFILFILPSMAIIVVLGGFLGVLGYGIGTIASLIFVSLFLPSLKISIPGIEIKKRKKILFWIYVILFVAGPSVVLGFIIGYSFYQGSNNLILAIGIGIVVGLAYFSLSHLLCLKKDESGKPKFNRGMYVITNLTFLIAFGIIWSFVGKTVTGGIGFNFPTLQFQLVKASQKYWEFTQLLTNPDYQEYQKLVGAEYEEEEISTGAPITKVFDIYLFEVAPKEANEEVSRYVTISISNYLDKDIKLESYLEIPEIEEKQLSFPGFSFKIEACPLGNVDFGNCPRSSSKLKKVIPKGGQDIVQCSNLKLKFRKDVSEDVDRIKCYIEAIVEGNFNSTAIYPITFMNKDLYEVILTQGNFNQYKEKPRATVSRGPLEIRLDLPEEQPIIVDKDNYRTIDLQVAYGKVGGGKISKEGFFAKIPMIAIFVPKILGTCQNNDFTCYDLDTSTQGIEDLQCSSNQGNSGSGNNGECNWVKEKYEKIKDDYYVCIKKDVQEFKVLHCILNLTSTNIKNMFGCNGNGCNRELATYYIGVYAPNYAYAIAKDAEIISTR